MPKTFLEHQTAFNQLGYVFKLNELNDIVECNGKRITDTMAARVKSQMIDRGFKSRVGIEEAWMRQAGDNPYNPVKEYFRNLQWNGQDVFGEWMSYLTFNEPKDAAIDDMSARFIWRFLVGCVGKLFDQQQNFMLIIDGVQGIGKSYLVWWLSPLKEYFNEGALNPDSKDSQLRMISYFLWEVGEFQATTRKSDKEALKNIIMQRNMVVRRSYGKYDLEKPIICNLVGTINENSSGYLTDTTGSRRFVTIQITGIDKRYSQSVNIDQLWAQIYTAYLQGETGHLSDIEAAERERINENYQMTSPAVELLHRYYEIDPDGKHKDEWIPISNIVVTLEQDYGLTGSQKFNQMLLAEELARMGCEKSRDGAETGHGRLTCYRGVAEKAKTPTASPFIP